MKRYKHSMRFKVETENGTINKRVYGDTIEECIKKKERVIEQTLQEAERKAHPYFKDVAAEWYEEAEKRLSPYSQKSYKSSMHKILEAFGEAKIDEIKASACQNIFDELAKKGYKKTTLGSYKQVALQIFDYAVLNDVIEFNPIASVKISRNAKNVEHYRLPQVQEIEIIKKSINAPLGLFYFFLLYTGMRRGEALAIDWKDINFEKKTITVNKTARFINNKCVIANTTKTESGMRVIPLLQPLEIELAKIEPKKGLLFQKKGKPYTHTMLIYAMRKYNEATGLQLTPHMLRVAYATMLYDANLNDKDAQFIMGHSNIQITKNIYMRISQERQHASFEKLNQFVTKK